LAIVPAPVSEYSGPPALFLQKESRGLKNHVVMKLIVDHSPLLSNVSCCVLSAVFLCPEKNYYYPLWLPSIKASRAVSEFFWPWFFPLSNGLYGNLAILGRITVFVNWRNFKYFSAVVGVTILRVTQRAYTFNCWETGARVKIAP